jgi:hypothetical protein
MKLTRRHTNVLSALDKAPLGLPLQSLPNGHGHAAGGHNASGTTLRELRNDGLIVSDQHFRSYVITEAGRAILSDLNAERAKP